MFKQKKAFTLIELLVVIAIIGILATLAVVALQQARQNARDSKRMADMKQIHTALELYYNENNRYPTTAEFQTGNPLVSSSTGEVFIHQIPSAPTPADGDCQPASNTYAYIPLNDGASYTIDFCTGKQVSDLPEGAKQMTPGGIIFGSSAPGEPAGPFAGTSGTFIDTRDSQEYAWVKIGDQIWMAENLNYDNGCSSVTWINGSDEGWCGCYNNDSNNCDIYGKLYQWSAAMSGSITEGAQGICPDGWHVPTDAEWTTLTNYLGADPGDQLKASSTDPLPNWDGNNDSGFTALPAGYRSTFGSFIGLGSYSYLWSSSIYGSVAWGRHLYSSDSSVGRSNVSLADGFSVRCLRTAE